MKLQTSWVRTAKDGAGVTGTVGSGAGRGDKDGAWVIVGPGVARAFATPNLTSQSSHRSLNHHCGVAAAGSLDLFR